MSGIDPPPCPKCKGKRHFANMDGRKAWYCRECREAVPWETLADIEATKEGNPPSAPRRKYPLSQAHVDNLRRPLDASPHNGESEPFPPFEGPESQLAAEVQAALEQLGFEVLMVGQHIAKGSGTTVGTPDLFYRSAAWGSMTDAWRPMELKTKTGTLSPEQARLKRDHGIPTVRSVAEAIWIATRRG